MLWFNILLTLAVCGAMFELVRRTFHLSDAYDDPKEARTLGVVAAVCTLMLLGISAIYLPYTLAGLLAALLVCLGFVVLLAAERDKQAQVEDATIRHAFLDQANGWGKP